MDNVITNEKLEHYFKLTGRALDLARESGNKTEIGRHDFLDMIERYYKDAQHFKSQGDIVNAFAALSYAHGWLDAGARIGIFDVHDNKLFTVD